MIFPEVPNRHELIRMVPKIIEVEGSETELDEMLDFVEKYSPHLNASDLSLLPRG